MNLREIAVSTRKNALMIKQIQLCGLSPEILCKNVQGKSTIAPFVCGPCQSICQTGPIDRIYGYKLGGVEGTQ